MTLFGQQTVGIGQAPPVSAAVHLYLKGANARLETAGEPTLVYDGKGNILYGLDTARKTYYMTVPVEVEPTDALPSGVGEVKEDTKLDLHETNQTMMLAGQLTHQYTVSGTVTFTRSRPEGMGQRGGGGRRRRGGGGGGFPGQNGGGFPGGANGGENGGERRPQAGTFTPPQWSISGEIWLADELKFPAKENTSLVGQLAAASSGPTTTVTTFTVRSVSDAPLDPKLFQAPLEYALVAAPLTPFAPGDLALGTP